MEIITDFGFLILTAHVTSCGGGFHGFVNKVFITWDRRFTISIGTLKMFVITITPWNINADRGKCGKVWVNGRDRVACDSLGMAREMKMTLIVVGVFACCVESAEGIQDQLAEPIVTHGWFTWEVKQLWCIVEKSKEHFIQIISEEMVGKEPILEAWYKDFLMEITMGMIMKAGPGHGQEDRLVSESDVGASLNRLCRPIH
jgi:hypothetical protein